MRHFEAKAVVGHRGLDGDTTAHHNDYGYDYGQPGGLRMITVSKSKLKARMLEYFRMVEESGEEIVVTNHNRPVLRITRLDHVHTVQELFADVEGLSTIGDDVLEPETEQWPEV